MSGEILPDAALDQIFRRARTRNSWSDRPVTDEQIRAIYDLAKWGPTSFNSAPGRFVWVRSAEGKEKLAACSFGANAAKIKVAPVTVIIGVEKLFYERMDYLFAHGPQMQTMMRESVPLAESTAQRSATLQGAYLMIAARALGLDCGPMSGFDQEKVNAAFFANKTVRANFICSMGYGTDENLQTRLPRLSFDEANTLC